MRLQELDVIVTAPPAPGWGGRYWILVKVTTSDGIVGWGECYASSVGPRAMEAASLIACGVITGVGAVVNAAQLR
ncbi:MAG: hypothetical protein AAGH73_11125, partial [Pseudomonadota bacterium]